jgi:hypothetical protein
METNIRDREEEEEEEEDDVDGNSGNVYLKK